MSPRDIAGREPAKLVVEQRHPTKAKRKSGLNRQARRTFRASAEEFSLQDRIAKTWGLTWTAWVRAVLASPHRGEELRIAKPSCACEHEDGPIFCWKCGEETPPGATQTRAQGAK